mgnify:CR=1 FL=1
MTHPCTIYRFDGGLTTQLINVKHPQVCNVWWRNKLPTLNPHEVNLAPHGRWWRGIGLGNHLGCLEDCGFIANGIK